MTGRESERESPVGPTARKSRQKPARERESKKQESEMKQTREDRVSRREASTWSHAVEREPRGAQS